MGESRLSVNIRQERPLFLCVSVFIIFHTKTCVYPTKVSLWKKFWRKGWLQRGKHHILEGNHWSHVKKIVNELWVSKIIGQHSCFGKLDFDRGNGSGWSDLRICKWEIAWELLVMKKIQREDIEKIRKADWNEHKLRKNLISC